MKIEDHTTDGWRVNVPQNQTHNFLDFYRGKMSLNIEVGGFSGGSLPDTDFFFFNSMARQEEVQSLIDEFEKK